MTRLLLLGALLAYPALASAQSVDAEDPCGRTSPVSASADRSPRCSDVTPARPDARIDPTATAWGYDVRSTPRTLLSFTLNDANNVADGPDLVAPDGELVQGCDFTNDDFETLYCMSTAGQLFSVDLSDGSTAVIGTGDYGGEGVTDITYSVTDDAWYAITVDLSAPACDTQTSLHTFSPADGSATLIGSDDGLTCGIALAAAPDGTLYAYGITTDNSATISTTDGSHTVLGPTGFDFNYAQSMDCDASDGTCYAFGYSTFGNGINGLFVLDPSTGAFEQVGVLAENAEYTAGAIAASKVIVAAEEGPLGSVSLDLIGANPARDRVRVGLRVETAQPVAVRVYDTLGREVAVLHEGAVAAGARLDLGADVSSWPAGAYLVRATGAGVALTQTVTVVH